jgi:TetR/AcrR family transcriptional regulator, transcriptional repressor for nem operon
MSVPGRVDTASAIVDLAEELVLDRGFNGFSYADIAAELGIRNAAIHYHFRSKCDLGVAVTRRARERFSFWARKLDASGAGPVERLDAFFRRYLRHLEHGRRVCLGGALETDYATLPEPMQDEARAFVAAVLSWWETLLEEGRTQGVFSFPGEARDQAVVVMSTLQGALQTSRLVEPPCLPAAMDQLRRLIIVR